MAVPRRRRLALVGLAVLLVLAGSTAALVALRRAGSAPPGAGAQGGIPATLAINLGDAGLYCPSSLAWAPDGRQVAVLGTSVPCIDRLGVPLTDPVPGAVAIFDARTGNVRQTFQLDRALAGQSLARAAGATGDLGWSPDGRTLATTMPVAPASPAAGLRQALVLLPADGGAARVAVAPWPADRSQVRVWDARAGDAAATTAVVPPPVLSYRWTAGGQIVPDRPLPAAGAERGYTGRPADDGAFSLWQDGAFTPIFGLNADGTQERDRPPVGYYFTASPVRWSPDSRYVAFAVRTGGFVGFSGPVDPRQCTDMAGGCAAYTVPQLPDAATAAVLAAMRQGDTQTSPDGGTTLTDWPDTAVAWSPDGQRLATILPGDALGGLAHPGRAAVTLLDTATGQATARLRYERAPTATSRTMTLRGMFMGWSPTVAQLAFADVGLDALTIWKV